MSLARTSKEDSSEATTRFGVVIAGGVAVFLLALLGVEMTRAAGNVASIWLANVVALGVLLRVQGATRLVSFMLSGLGIYAANHVYGDPINISLGLTAANLLEIALGAIVLIGIGFERKDIVRSSGFFRFVAIAGVLAPLAGGVAGAMVLSQMVGAPFMPVFQTWVFSGVLGAVIIGPAIIAPVTFAMDRRPLAIWEIAGWSVASASIIWLTTTTQFGALVYLLPGLVIVAGIRLGLTASGLVGAVLAVYVAWNLVTGAGNLPFGGDLLAGQIFLLGASIASHLVAILWHQRLLFEDEKDKYVRAMQGAFDGILLIDAEDRFIAWNDALVKIMPWIPENIEAGRPAFQAENKEIAARLRAGETISDHRMTRPDMSGGIREFMLSAAPLLHDGVYQGATVTIRDITENLLLRQTARRRAAELEAFIDSTRDIVIGTDSKGTITIWNRYAEEFYGHSRDEALGKKIFEIGGTEQLRQIRETNFKRIMAGEAINNVRSIRTTSEGEERVLVLSINPVVDHRGEIIGTMGHHRDVTELVELQNTSERFQLLLDNAFAAVSDGLAIYDAQDKLVRCNDAYADLIGESAETLPVGQTWEEIVRRNLRQGNIDVPEEQWDSWISERRHLIAQGGSSFIIQLRDKRWLLGNDYPIDGGGFISVRQDVTELKTAQERLEESNKELEQFAFVASHDLQEPLRKINSFGSILVSDYSDDLPDEAQRFVQSMMGAANRMQELIRDLLAYSRLQKPETEPKLCNLNELVDIVVGSLEVQIAESGASIDIEDLGSVKADRTSLLRVIQNLVVNAIKYRRTDVPLEVKIVSAPTDPSFVGFTVQDNGQGFEMRFADQIMEPFKRLHAQSDVPGTGMGLAIVQKILKTSGGSLKVHAEPEAGAAFTVYLPREPNSP